MDVTQARKSATPMKVSDPSTTAPNTPVLLRPPSCRSATRPLSAVEASVGLTQKQTNPVIGVEVTMRPSRR